MVLRRYKRFWKQNVQDTIQQLLYTWTGSLSRLTSVAMLLKFVAPWQHLSCSCVWMQMLSIYYWDGTSGWSDWSGKLAYHRWHHYRSNGCSFEGYCENLWRSVCSLVQLCNVFLACIFYWLQQTRVMYVKDLHKQLSLRLLTWKAPWIWASRVAQKHLGNAACIFRYCSASISFERSCVVIRNLDIQIFVSNSNPQQRMLCSVRRQRQVLGVEGNS